MRITSLGLHVHVAVEHQETAIFEPGQRIDLGQGEVVHQEDLDQREDDGRELVEVTAGHTRSADGFLRDAGRDRQDRRQVGLGNVVRVLLGHLFDVDAPHVAEDHDGKLAAAVPGDTDVVLLGNRALRLDQHRGGLLSVHLDAHDRVEKGAGLIRGFGELDGAGLHAAARQDLALQDYGSAQLEGHPTRLVGAVGQTVLGERQPVASEQRLGFVLIEAHGGLSWWISDSAEAVVIVGWDGGFAQCS